MDNATPTTTNTTPSPAADALGNSTPLYAQNAPEYAKPVVQPADPTPPQVNDAGPNPLSSLPGVVPAEPVSAHRNLAAKILGALGDILGGKTHDEYSYDANGKLVTNKVQNTRTQQVGTILGNAMRGEAAGLQYRGPGAKAHSIGAGATAVMDQQKQNDQLARSNAREDAETSNRVMLAKAQTAHITQETARSTWELSANKIKFTSESMNAVAQLQQQIAGDPRSVDYGTYDSPKDFFDKHPDLQAAAKGMTSTTRVVPEIDKDGNIKVHVFSVAPDWATQKVDHDMQVPIFGGYELGKDGKPDLNKPKFTSQTVKAGSMTNDQFYSYSNAQFTKQADVVRQQQETQDKHDLTKAQIAHTKAETSASYAAASKSKAEAAALNGDNLGDNDLVDGMLNGTVDITKVANIRSGRREQLVKQAIAKDPNFNMQNYAIRLKTAESFATGYDGKQIQAFTTFAQHAGEASKLIDSARNSNTPYLNKPFNWIKKNVSGDPAYQAYVTSLAPALTEYMSVLKGGDALSKHDEDVGNTILSGDLSPAQTQAALKEMMGTAAVRLGTTNNKYKRVFHTNVPNLIDPDTEKVMRNMGYGAKVDQVSKTAMKAPDGTIQLVPDDQVPHFLSLGAKVQ